MTRSGHLDLTRGRLPSCCAAIAGMLAEHSITRITIEPSAGSPRLLLARDTDLPGELQRAAPCTLRMESPSHLELRLTATSIEWTTDDDALASSLAHALR